MANSEKTLVIIKPDGVQRLLVGTILQRLERRGLKIVAMELRIIDEDLAKRHYAQHEGKSFFPGLIEYITSGAAVVLVLEGPDAIDVTRKTVGETKPGEAAPGTIRGDFALTIGRNLIHASDSVESGEREVALFFGNRVLDYPRDQDAWILSE